jgi:hypothetical protein
MVGRDVPVLLKTQDFNNAEGLFAGKFAARWAELADALAKFPLQLKASQQEGKEGSAIFDPVASNAVIKDDLARRKWPTNTPIPEGVAFLGTDVDFFVEGLLVEAQFSNYPFFLNNVVRSALLAKSKTKLGNSHVEAVAIIAKAHMFPASNSTLYYEQAVNQLTEFSKHGVFDVPVRVVGLFSDIDCEVPAVWNQYPGRYSRAPTKSETVKCILRAGSRANSICKIDIIRSRR